MSEAVFDSNSLQVKFCLRLVQETTLPVSQIADYCGISKSTAYNYINNFLGPLYIKNRMAEIRRGLIKDKMTPEAIKEIAANIKNNPQAADAQLMPLNNEQDAHVSPFGLQVVEIEQPLEHKPSPLAERLPDYDDIFYTRAGQKIHLCETKGHGTLTGRSADVYEFCEVLYGKYHTLPNKRRIHNLFKDLTGICINWDVLTRVVDIWAEEHNQPVVHRSSRTELRLRDDFAGPELSRVPVPAPKFQKQPRRSSGRQVSETGDALKVSLNGIELMVSGNHDEAARFIAQIINSMGA